MFYSKSFVNWENIAGHQSLAHWYVVHTCKCLTLCYYVTMKQRVGNACKNIVGLVPYPAGAQKFIEIPPPKRFT